MISRKEAVFSACVMFSVTCLIISNITASKLYDLSIFGLELIVPVGTVLFCFSFLATDVISEVWGRSHALFVVFLGLVARILAAVFFVVAISIPGVETWSNQEAYASILGASSRILTAGIVAYLVASVIDAYVFHFFREKHKGRNLLFIRNNISTFTAHLIGATLFVVIAFYGILPTEKLIQIIMGNMLIKWIVALIDTPLIYMIRNFTLGQNIFYFRG